jgi:small GTP-binding protein
MQMLPDDNRLTFRTVTIGDSSVGKTSIVNRFIRDRFDASEKNTIGALYDSYTDRADGQEVEVQIWDTAGQEQYRSLAPVYFRSAAAALLVFDLTNRDTFTSLDNWLASFRVAIAHRAVLFLVGNKLDLVSDRQITIDEARNWARANECSYYETSAKNGQGVHELFRALAATLASSGARPQPAIANKATAREHTQTGEKTCC